MIAFSASTTGAGGTRVRPAPSRAVRSRTEPEFTRWVMVEPPPSRCEPKAVEPSRLDPRVIVDNGASAPAAPRRYGGLLRGADSAGGAADVAVAVDDGAGAARLACIWSRCPGPVEGVRERRTGRRSGGRRGCWRWRGLDRARAAADVAVAVDDRAGAARLGAPHERTSDVGRDGAQIGLVERDQLLGDGHLRGPAAAESRWPAGRPGTTSGCAATPVASALTR